MQTITIFQKTVCVALAIAVATPLTHSQEDRSTRIFRAAKNIENELDPTAIESEVINSINNDVRESANDPFKKVSTREEISTKTSSIFSASSVGNGSIKNAIGELDQPIQLKPTKTTTGPMGIQSIGTLNPNSRTFRNVVFPSSINSDMYETKSTPTIQTQIVAPKTTNINQSARFFIQAQNIGNEVVSNFKLIATLPTHAKFVGSMPEPTNIDGQNYEFTFNSLGARSKQVIQIDITPTQKIPLNIATQIQIQSEQQVAVTVQQPVLEVSVSSPPAVQTGKTVSHEVTVRNVGDGVAESVRVNTQRPQELEIGKPQQKTLVPKLGPGQSTKFVLSSFATSAGNSNITFQVSAKGATTRETSTPIRIIQPELGVQILGPSQNYLGRDGIYTIQLQNTSEMPITEVFVQLNVPNGLNIDTISQQAEIDNQSNTLLWEFENIPGNQQQVIQFRAKATKVGSQVCQVNVRTGETASKELSLSTQVMGRADLSIRVTDSGEPIGVGSKSDFNIEVTNHGSLDAEKVAVQVELPSALMPVNQAGYTIDPAGNVITFNNVSLEAGKRMNLKFKVVAVTAGEHVVKGSVQQDGSATSISSENSIFVFESENAKVSEALVPEIRR